MCEASDSVDNFSVTSNLANAQNVSCLELCGRVICPRTFKKVFFCRLDVENLICYFKNLFIFCSVTIMKFAV